MTTNCTLVITKTIETTDCNHKSLSDLPLELIYAIIQKLSLLELRQLSFTNQWLMECSFSYVKDYYKKDFEPILKLINEHFTSEFPISQEFSCELEEQITLPLLEPNDDNALREKIITEITSIKENNPHKLFGRLREQASNVKNLLMSSNHIPEKVVKLNFTRYWQEFKSTSKLFIKHYRSFEKHRLDLVKKLIEIKDVQDQKQFANLNRQVRIHSIYLLTFLVTLKKVPTNLEKDAKIIPLQNFDFLKDQSENLYRHDLKGQIRFIEDCLKTNAGIEILSMLLYRSLNEIQDTSQWESWLSSIKDIYHALKETPQFKDFAQSILYIKNYIPSGRIDFFLNLKKFICLDLLETKKNFLIKILLEMPDVRWIATILNELIIKNERLKLESLVQILENKEDPRLNELLYYARGYLYDETVQLPCHPLEIYKSPSLKNLTPQRYVIQFHQTDEYDNFIAHSMGYHWLTKKLIEQKGPFEMIQSFIFEHRLFSVNLFESLITHHKNFKHIAYFFFQLCLSDQIDSFLFDKFRNVFFIYLENEFKLFLHHELKQVFLNDIDFIFKNPLFKETELQINAFESAMLALFFLISPCTNSEGHLLNVFDSLFKSIQSSCSVIVLAQRVSTQPNFNLLSSHFFEDQLSIFPLSFEIQAGKGKYLCLLKIDSEANFLNNYQILCQKNKCAPNILLKKIHYKFTSNSYLLNFAKKIINNPWLLTTQVQFIHSILEGKIFDDPLDETEIKSFILELQNFNFLSPLMTHLCHAAKINLSEDEFNSFWNNRKSLRDYLKFNQELKNSNLTTLTWLAKAILKFKGYPYFINFLKKHNFFSLEVYKIALKEDPQLAIERTEEFLSIFKDHKILSCFLENKSFMHPSLIHSKVIYNHIKISNTIDIKCHSSLLDYLLQMDCVDDKDTLTCFEWIFEIMKAEVLNTDFINRFLAKFKQFIHKLGFNSIFDRSKNPTKKYQLIFNQFYKLVALNSSRLALNLSIRLNLSDTIETIDEMEALLRLNLSMGLSRDIEIFNCLLRFIVTHSTQENYDKINEIVVQFGKAFDENFFSLLILREFSNMNKLNEINKKLHLIHLILKYNWPINSSKISLDSIFSELKNATEIDQEINLINAISQLMTQKQMIQSSKKRKQPENEEIDQPDHPRRKKKK